MPPFVAVGEFGCFYLSSDLGLFVNTQEAAVSLCDAHGGKLAIVDTLDKNTILKDHFIIGSKFQIFRIQKILLSLT